MSNASQLLGLLQELWYDIDKKTRDLERIEEPVLLELNRLRNEKTDLSHQLYLGFKL